MNTRERIILASKSPRRARLLTQIGLSFEVLPAEIEEEIVNAGSPAGLAMALARLKAEAAAQNAGHGLIIGADTVVSLDDSMLGKPKNAKEAASMLGMLSGRTHHVYTGFTLLQTGGGSIIDYADTAVTFKPLEDWEIDLYVATGSPLDKAGAYGIQDVSSLFVTGIEGCFYNVVGLPLNRFYHALTDLWGSKRVQQALTP